MQDSGYELPRIPIPRTWVNKSPSGVLPVWGIMRVPGAALPTQYVHSLALQAKCPDSGVECVGDVENARILVDEQAYGVVKPHFGRRPFLAVEPRLARAGDSRDLALWIDLADHAVVVVGYVHFFLSIDGDAPRAVKSSLGGRPSVPRVAMFARSRDCVDDAVLVDLTDPLVVQIADVDVSFVIERNVVGAQFRLRSRTSVAREAKLPGACYGGDSPGGVDLPHAGVVGYVEVPLSVEGETARIPELGGGGRASVTGIASRTRAGKGGDDAVFVHLANPIVVLVCDVEVPFPVHRHGEGHIELCLGGWPAIAGETGLSGARHGRDGPSRVHLPNGIATGSATIDPPVRYVHVSFRVERNVAGAAESGLRRGTAVSEFRTTVARHRRELWLWLRSLP